MLGIVLPLTAARLAAVNVATIDVVNVVPVKIIVVVNVDVAVAPIAIAPVVAPIRAPGQASAQGQTHPGVVTRVIVRIVRVRWRTVDDRRIVGRNVNDLRIGILNYDHILSALYSSCLYFLLRAGL